MNCSGQSHSTIVFFRIAVVAICFFAARVLGADPAVPTLTLEAGDNARHVSPTFFGLMTEEINHSYDGGLYAELIRNRSFADDVASPAHWSLIQDNPADAAMALDQNQPVNPSLPSSLRVDVHQIGGKRVAIANDGYWGIPIQPDTVYRVSFFAKAAEGTVGSLRAGIEGENGVAGTSESESLKLKAGWQRYEMTLKTRKDIKPSKDNRFVISMYSPGTYWFSLVSLMPPTWHDRPNGCRVDLMQLMSDLKPAFLRCPGGNYLEGDSVDTRFNWKKTLGDVSTRPGHMGTWTYRSSDGLGLLEFLEWAQDIGADPVLAVYAGFSLPSKDHPGGTSVPAGAELKPFVDEAVEEIEYATGDAHTKWGARRMADGHPAPFHIQYVEVGNEDFLDKARKTYEARFAQFHDAIKSAYPQIQLIATIPVKSRTADAVDDHYYKTSDQMAGLVHRYDKTDRNGPKVFVGEWATREIAKPNANGKTEFVMMPWSYKGGPTPTMHAALGDAAFMTGLERNADVVVMNCYAPMLTRVDPGSAQWCPNMIGYDALSSFASPSYYVQQMFNLNLGDSIINASMTQEPRDCFCSATRSTKGGNIFLKFVNRSDSPAAVHIVLNGVKTISPDGDLIVLSAADPMAVNSIDEPLKIAPVKTALHSLGPDFTQTFAANSLAVIRIACQ